MWIAMTAAVAGACTQRTEAPQQATETSAPPTATHVGAAVCAECHEKQAALWQGSDHRLAMQPATSATVVANFNRSTFTYGGVTSNFFLKDGSYAVRTDGPDGKHRDYRVAFTFGIRPLQQYLVEFTHGRYQALGIAWDNRPSTEGGQRWFHLYQKGAPAGPKVIGSVANPGAGKTVDFRDELHWTRPAHTWNYMCAECHSTGLQKGYRETDDQYNTTWLEINVSCESCHGPGSVHVKWGRLARTGKRSAEALQGLVFGLKDRSGGAWTIPAGETTATRTTPLTSRSEVETCGRCHARRAQIWPDYRFGDPLAQTHEVSLLDEELYEADGQIRDEVFEYGSFLQSKMYASGVTCSSCHNPHSGKLLFQGNAICTQCHLAGKYDTDAHHFHKAGTEAAGCVSCHMPRRYYMVIDGRHDHGFRVPRPDLTAAIGTPNPCAACHNEPPQWAADAVVKWRGSATKHDRSFAEALHAGRARLPHGLSLLGRVVADLKVAPIVRATALTLLPRYSGPEVAGAISRAATDPDPLVRRAAALTLEALAPTARLRVGTALLRDPIRTVRIHAVLPMASIARGVFARDMRDALDRAADEFRRVQQFNADRAEAHVNLGTLEAHLGRYLDAEAAFRTAIRLQPQFAPAHVNLADVLRATGREAEAEDVLRRALTLAPDIAEVHSALGLALVRQGRTGDALAELARALELAPDDPGHAYVYAVALHDTGAALRAINLLENVNQRFPADLNILQALVSYSIERGDLSRARAWAQKIVDAAPSDPAALQQLQSLQPTRSGTR